eukprot:3475686-Amphidinium_carterae.1
MLDTHTVPGRSMPEMQDGHYRQPSLLQRMRFRTRIAAVRCGLQVASHLGIHMAPSRRQSTQIEGQTRSDSQRVTQCDDHPSRPPFRRREAVVNDVVKS